MPTAASAQQFLTIDSIREDIIVLKDGGLRVVLMCSSFNFALKSSDEQDAVIFQYQNFLNALDFPIQFVVHSRRLNTEPYLEALAERQVPVFARDRGITTSHQFAIEAGAYGGGQAAARKLRAVNILSCGIGLPLPEVAGDINGLRLGTPEIVRFGLTPADMPELAGFVDFEGHVCWYDNTPDGDFILDRLPDAPNGFVAAGLSDQLIDFAEFVLQRRIASSSRASRVARRRASRRSRRLVVLRLSRLNDDGPLIGIQATERERTHEHDKQNRPRLGMRSEHGSPLKLFREVGTTHRPIQRRDLPQIGHFGTGVFSRICLITDFTRSRCPSRIRPLLIARWDRTGTANRLMSSGMTNARCSMRA